MWESLKDIIIKIVESPLLYVGTMGVLFVLLKKGLITIDTKAVKIGRSKDLERRIISSQIEFLQLHFSALSSKMKMKMPDVNKYHTAYVCEKLLDEAIKRCCINHITNDDVYIEGLAQTFLDIIRKRSTKEMFWEKAFEDFVYDEAKFIVARLLSIRMRLSK